jgi:replicative DNA helicase
MARSTPVDFASAPPDLSAHSAALYSEDAEKAVLCSMMMEPAAVASARLILRDDSFFREDHKKIYRALCSLADSGAAVEPLAAVEYLKAHYPERTEAFYQLVGVEILDFVPSASNVEHYAGIVRERHDRRKLINLAGEMIQQARDLSARPVEIAQLVTSALLPVAAHTKERGFVPVADLVLEAMEEIERRGKVPEGEVAGITFGYRDLNRHTGGGKRGEVMFLCGVPGSGKTALMLNIILRAVLDSKVASAIVSAEMGSLSLVERMLNASALVETLKTRTGNMDAAEWKSLGRAAGFLAHHAPLWIDDTATPNLRDIEAKCRALKAKHPELSLIGLDFIQLIEGQNDENRSLDLTRIAYRLKGLAKELQVFFIVTCQVDAAAVEKTTDNRPRLSMLRWSQAMREAGDLIGLVYRRGMYEVDAVPDVEIDMAKARDLAPFRVRLRWTGRYMLVEDWL